VIVALFIIPTDASVTVSGAKTVGIFERDIVDMVRMIITTIVVFVMLDGNRRKFL
jgi:hypothetical protein